MPNNCFWNSLPLSEQKNTVAIVSISLPSVIHQSCTFYSQLLFIIFFKYFHNFKSKYTFFFFIRKYKTYFKIHSIEIPTTAARFTSMLKTWYPSQKKKKFKKINISFNRFNLSAGLCFNWITHRIMLRYCDIKYLCKNRDIHFRIGYGTQVIYYNVEWS